MNDAQVNNPVTVTKISSDHQYTTYKLGLSANAYPIGCTISHDRSQIGFTLLDNSGMAIGTHVWMPAAIYLRSQGLFTPEVIPGGAYGCPPSPRAETATDDWSAAGNAAGRTTAMRVLEEKIETLEKEYGILYGAHESVRKELDERIREINELRDRYEAAPFVTAPVLSVTKAVQRKLSGNISYMSYLLPLVNLSVSKPNVKTMNDIREALGADDVEYVGMKEIYMREAAPSASIYSGKLKSKRPPAPADDESDED